MTAALARGFADPVLEAQAHFRALMDALARPGTTQPFAPRLAPPLPLSPGLAAAALTLADHEAPIFLDEALATAQDVAAYLRFHTGARIAARPEDAAFALVSSFDHLPPFAAFAEGSDEYPDRSTTIFVAVGALGAGKALEGSGPGIAGSIRFAVDPWPARLLSELHENRRRFPRGVDLVLVGPESVVGLPRTTRIREV